MNIKTLPPVDLERKIGACLAVSSLKLEKVLAILSPSLGRHAGRKLEIKGKCCLCICDSTGNA